MIKNIILLSVFLLLVLTAQVALAGQQNIKQQKQITTKIEVKVNTFAQKITADKVKKVNSKIPKISKKNPIGVNKLGFTYSLEVHQTDVCTLKVGVFNPRPNVELQFSSPQQVKVEIYQGDKLLRSLPDGSWIAVITNRMYKSKTTQEFVMTTNKLAPGVYRVVVKFIPRANLTEKYSIDGELKVLEKVVSITS